MLLTVLNKCNYKIFYSLQLHLLINFKLQVPFCKRSLSKLIILFLCMKFNTVIKLGFTYSDSCKETFYHSNIESVLSKLFEVFKTKSRY